MDPVTFELIHARLASAADEMAISLQRAAFSAAAREMMDFSTAITDVNGRTVVQGVGLTIQLGLIPEALPGVIEAWDEPWREGDVLLLNHPYVCGAHLNDLMAFSPIIVDSVHIGFAATILHHLDVGGRVPGSMAADNRQIYEDGLMLPPMKIVDAGEWDSDLVSIFRANVRTPAENMGDLRAQVAALQRGENEVATVCATWDIDTVREFFSAVQEYSKEMARREVERFPDGEYTFEDWIDEDGINAEPVVIRATIRVAGTKLSVDFAGTADQRECGINSPMNSTRSITYAALRSAMQGPLPENSGLYDAIEVVAPVASIVNAQAPVAVGARGVTLFRVADTLCGALAQFAPERIPAAGDGGPLLLVISGTRPDGTPFVFLDMVSGGFGARANSDGLEAAPHLGLNHANTPVEVIETEFPIRIEEYGFVPNSEGAGQFRGSLATVRTYTVLSDVVCVLRGDRHRIRPWALAGGAEGSPSRVFRCRADETIELPTKTVIKLRAGESLRYVSASGGGWGNPGSRDPAAVARDVEDQKVTPERAAAIYGWSSASANSGASMPAAPAPHSLHT